jgi:MazG family protein
MEMPEFYKLTQVVKKLRDPEQGCPWDLKQTHESLLKYLVEESYEFIAAVEKNDMPEMEDEIGDVLLQVLLHCQFASEENNFDIESVSKNLADKMIRRHPHVFEKPVSGIDAEQVVTNWEEIKLKEKADTPQSLIDDSYLKFPALFAANKIGKKTNKINFDWDDAAQVSYKVEEEWQELKEEIVSHKATSSKISKDRMFEEMGDFLFSAAQLARHLDIDPEEACRQANKKFLKRFQKMEVLIKDDGKDINQMNQKEMDHFWDQVKINEKP